MGASLVLGSEGLVGRSLCRYLEETGNHVRRLDLRRGPGEDLRTCDIDLAGVDEVYLLAWNVGGSRWLYRPGTQADQLEWNLKLLTNTLPQLARAGVPWLFVSTQLAGTQNAYGLGKGIGEYWTKIAGGCCVRLWNVYGEVEADDDRRHLLGDCIAQALAAGEIRLQTDGRELRRFLFERDAARGLVQALRSRPAKVYDLAPEAFTSVLEAAQVVAETTGARLTRGLESAIDGCVGFPRILPGFAAQTDLAVGIRIMIERYRRQA